MSDDDELTQQDAADRLRVSVRTLQRMRAAGAGPTYRKVSERKIRYPAELLEEYRQQALVSRR